ncbi:hypothetical protein PsorP6_018856 [Peronosclerospora sorghi]|nr:hypothetical protein PsorP6_018858 [Peronosclerospora sorghi]KAI9895513.1 hypothetical protein PsorP6_018856 [Peronosclerospora sorghi]
MSAYQEPSRAIFAQSDLRHFLGSPPMRFGNKAFRTFYDRVIERKRAMQEKMLLEELRGAVIEMTAYLDFLSVTDSDVCRS